MCYTYLQWKRYPDPWKVQREKRHAYNPARVLSVLSFMKERGVMPQQHRLIQLPLVGRILLYSLAGVYLVYLVGLGNFLYTWVSTRSETVIDHPVDTNPGVIISHWTAANMLNATDADQQIGNAPDLTQGSIDTSAGKAAQQQGQPPRNGNPAY